MKDSMSKKEPVKTTEHPLLKPCYVGGKLREKGYKAQLDESQVIFLREEKFIK